MLQRHWFLFYLFIFIYLNSWFLVLHEILYLNTSHNIFIFVWRCYNFNIWSSYIFSLIHNLFSWHKGFSANVFQKHLFAQFFFRTSQRSQQLLTFAFGTFKIVFRNHLCCKLRCHMVLPLWSGIIKTLHFVSIAIVLISCTFLYFF